jgi:UDP-N-acetylmuramate dehydrogenase
MRSVIRENVRLAPYTTLKIGGIARYFADIACEAELQEALQFAEQHRLSVFVLGGGSNVLIADAGFPGLVIHIVNQGITFHKPKKDAALVTAAAGEEWDKFVRQCVAHKLAGVECLSGIPGYVGGTPIQNVGAYGQEVSATIVSVRAFDRQAKQTVEMTNADCQFSYRASLFNTTARERYIVLNVTYKLKPHGEPALRYADLQKHFAAQATSPTLQEVRDAVLKIRASKGMVIVPSDPDCQSAGSFFKNPVVTLDQFAQVEAAASESVPHFAAALGQVKIPAAWLIEKAGFPKGYERGRVGISSKHTLAIINRNYATATELLAFVEHIQKKVQERFGIALVPEPVLIGLENQIPISLTSAQPPPKPAPPQAATTPLASPVLLPPRKFRRPAHNPLKTERKKWFE